MSPLFPFATPIQSIASPGASVTQTWLRIESSFQNLGFVLDSKQRRPTRTRLVSPLQFFSTNAPKMLHEWLQRSTNAPALQHSNTPKTLQRSNAPTLHQRSTN